MILSSKYCNTELPQQLHMCGSHNNRKYLHTAQNSLDFFDCRYTRDVNSDNLGLSNMRDNMIMPKNLVMVVLLVVFYAKKCFPVDLDLRPNEGQKLIWLLSKVIKGVNSEDTLATPHTNFGHLLCFVGG